MVAIFSNIPFVGSDVHRVPSAFAYIISFMPNILSPLLHWPVIPVQRRLLLRGLSEEHPKPPSPSCLLSLYSVYTTTVGVFRVSVFVTL